MADFYIDDSNSGVKPFSQPCLVAALSYAQAGFALFPAPRGSKASYKSMKDYGGVRWGATRDLEEIKRDWARWPYANIGIPTGKDNGIFVVETDTKAHGDEINGGRRSRS